MILTAIKTTQVFITDVVQMVDRIIGQLGLILIVHKIAKILRAISIVAQITM